MRAIGSKNAIYDPDLANKLLDGVGLLRRHRSGLRRLPNGRPLEIVVEVAGDSRDAIFVLELITEFWREVGVSLLIKPQEPGVLRLRSSAGRTVMVAGPGLDNAIPTAKMSPAELAPVFSQNYSWPLWGNTPRRVASGAKRWICPMPSDCSTSTFNGWQRAMLPGRPKSGRRCWPSTPRNVFSIGTVTCELQPIVASKRLHNVPDKALFAFEPTSYFGVYRIDEFFFSE
jgi:peptide/nickel transport system substrate-binding protein